MTTLYISSKNVSTMKWELRRARSREIGGILMAEQIGNGEFRLVEFSVDRKTGTDGRFTRNEMHHVPALKEFFARHDNNYSKYNYLGEWHSHPSYSVHPSAQDIATMVKLVNSPGDTKFATLMIVRLDYWLKLRISVLLFVEGQEPETVKIVLDKD